MNRSFILFVVIASVAQFTVACTADTSEAAATDPSEQISSSEAASSSETDEVHGGVNPSLTELNGVNGIEDRQSPFTKSQEIEAAKLEASNLHHGATVDKPAKDLASATMAIAPKK